MRYAAILIKPLIAAKTKLGMVPGLFATLAHAQTALSGAFVNPPA